MPDDDTTTFRGRTLSGCDRFFSTAELVTLLLLEHTELPTLIKCQRVCRAWHDIIRTSPGSSERLFLSARVADSSSNGDEHFEAILNPVMEQYFAPIWKGVELISLSAHQYALRAAECRYSDLAALPWARDGTCVTAPARQAFARPEASWRNMLVSQPPVLYLDWWHDWESSDRRLLDGLGGDRPLRSGQGHQLSTGRNVTLGQLWDFLEARLFRGCTIQVTFFPLGGHARDDPSATPAEKQWQSSPQAAARGFAASLPRIRVCSSQVWPGEGPALYNTFNIQTRAWQVHDELLDVTSTSERERRRYEVYDGDGTYWLAADCRRDAEPANARWSRSEAWEGLTLRSITSTMSGGNSRRAERARARAAERARARQGGVDDGVS